MRGPIFGTLGLTNSIRGYSDTDIQKIAGGNALAFFRRVMC